MGLSDDDDSFWSPNGQYLAFHSTATATRSVHDSGRLEPGPARQLTFNDVFSDAVPVWARGSVHSSWYTTITTITTIELGAQGEFEVSSGDEDEDEDPAGGQQHVLASDPSLVAWLTVTLLWTAPLLPCNH